MKSEPRKQSTPKPSRKASRKAQQALRRHVVRLTSLVVVLLLLPILLLLPAGLIWLWQQGWIYWWLLSAMSITLVVSLIALWIQRRLRPRDRTTEAGSEPESGQQDEEPVTDPNSDWSPQDMEAWREVQSLAQHTDKSILASRTLLLERARTVIERVAQHYYPEQKDPIWNFTLPEALLLSERISQRLRIVLLTHVPAAHMVQVGQIMRLWQMKAGSMKVYQGAYLAYRLVRLVNPIAALLAEARERIVEVAFGNTSQYLRQKGARIWVEEVGRAAIELYSGRLQADSDALADAAATEALTRNVPGPVQVLVAGQVNVGKSSLINALLDDTQSAVDLLPMTTGSQGYQLSQDGEPIAVLIDSPGITAEQSVDWWAEHCATADCILWVVAANRADRELDHKALEAIRSAFRANPKRSMPPVLLLISHVDRLSPAREWSPPYDLQARTQPKAAAMGEAIDQITHDLKLQDADAVPVRLDQGKDGYNIDLLWGLLKERLETAKQGRAQRLHLMARKKDWQKLLQQARGAGRLLKSTWQR